MSLTAQGQMVLKQLTQLLNMGLSVEGATEQLRVMLQNDELIDSVLLERQSIIDSQWKLSLNNALADPEDLPAPWYTGPLDTDKFWPRLKSALETDPDWQSAVASLDETSTDVVGLLADPHSPIIATRGLVLGYVQSGKTANFTATIAKAADAGYRLFIVLSGVHNALRRQTQLRMDEQLTNLNQTEWIDLTDEYRDFGNPVKALPLVAGTQLKLLAVVKKNVSRLTRLREWLETAQEQGGLDNCPVLIIDDEADQASPNTHKDPDLDRTKINKELVGLLSLPRVAYVGYTATPFANILANPADAKGIYPRSFIKSLPKPPGYFGAEELFGALLSEDEEAASEVSTHDMIRFVDDAEAQMYVVKPKQPFDPVLTPTLRDAVRWFVLATAARRARSGESRHSSMLVHTTMRVQPQLAYVPLIKEYVSALRDQLRSGSDLEWRNYWDAEVMLEPAWKHGLATLGFDELAPLLDTVLGEITVVADNSQSNERLLYAKEPATVIAVGGNTLSRGLTLHGLTSSFFLRSGSAYDSVLQMGRWFGYRPGYGDLPRIWTTKQQAEDFLFLSQIEAGIREDIERYSSGSTKPLELAVRIQLHPRMQPTAKLKMHYAVMASASFSEHRPQTTYLNYRDPEASANNLLAASQLVHSAFDSQRPVADDSYLVFQNLPATQVLDFLDLYTFHDSSEMSGGLLKNYVEEQMAHGGLLHWNLAIVTRRQSTAQLEIGMPNPVNLITRSKLILGSDRETANIGTLMSRKDRLVDLEGSGLRVEDSDSKIQDERNKVGRALLLIYPIDKDSVPRSGADNRTPLDSVDHQIGVAVVFPIAAAGSEQVDKIQVHLLPSDVDEDDAVAYADTEGSRDEVNLDG